MSKLAILANYSDAARWAFGDGPELADELLQLVLSGDKTATCCSYASYQQDQTPALGDYSIILDGRGEPACVIRTLTLRLIRYDQVTAKMAAKEGEGDKSLAFWRRGHREFFTREGTFAADMWLVFEEFALVEIL
ncbi:ASCH domain-containing protein [Serratia marcescens]|uniref:ASCH domain-containing protein n=1 Tax=Serratia marcescens TaxID=615 RepID=A0A1Q4P022_SERMA|nr:ASCH domain-containing protein [Serratia marcescens]OKB66462.1 ASCH domain-containing protein [Serratia marcescens]